MEPISPAGLPAEAPRKEPAAALLSALLALRTISREGPTCPAGSGHSTAPASGRPRPVGWDGPSPGGHALSWEARS